MTLTQVPDGYARAGYITGYFSDNVHTSSYWVLQCNECSSLVREDAYRVQKHDEFHAQVNRVLAAEKLTRVSTTRRVDDVI